MSGKLGTNFAMREFKCGQPNLCPDATAFRVAEVYQLKPRVAPSEPDLPTSQPWAEGCNPFGIVDRRRWADERRPRNGCNLFGIVDRRRWAAERRPRNGCNLFGIVKRNQAAASISALGSSSQNELPSSGFDSKPTRPCIRSIARLTMA